MEQCGPGDGVFDHHIHDLHVFVRLTSNSSLIDNFFGFGLLIMRYGIQIGRVVVYFKRIRDRKRQMSSIQKINLRPNSKSNKG